MSRFFRLTHAVAVLLIAGPAFAQTPVQSASPASSPVDSVAIVAVAPSPASDTTTVLTLRPVAVNHLFAGITPAPAALPVPERTSRNVALMVVGGAGLVVGAVVGGKSGGVIMTAGAVVGLVGLWKYLK
jgi:hypothetical protein